MAAQLTSAGGRYRLCWCAGLHFTCSVAEDFLTDLGELDLVGPSPLSQDRTCVSGQNCAFDGITGLHLSTKDTFLALDTCGTNSVLPRFVDRGNLVEVTESGAAVRWGSILVSTAGGQYRLCWCGAASATHPPDFSLVCSTAESFRTDAGQLLILGPSPLSQHRTCVSGFRCELDGLQFVWGAGANLVLALDTCSTRSTLPRFANSGLFTANFNASWPASSGAIMSLGDAAVTASGGEYRLCWCAAQSFNCAISGNFRVDMGQLTLVGIAPLYQDHTCVSGQRCLLDGLTGNFMTQQNRLMVLDTCANPSVVPRFPAAGITVSVTASGQVASWVQAEVSAAGGRYRLCWCAGISRSEVANSSDTSQTPVLSGNGSQPSLDSSCLLADDFKTDAGELTLLGVSPLYQDRTCISGRTCAFDGIYGIGLDSGVQILILDTCGSSSWLPRQPKVAGSGAAMVSWGQVALAAAAGDHRLCWWDAPRFTCSIAENFRVDFGTWTSVKCVLLSQHRTCFSGQQCEHGHLAYQRGLLHAA